ncbi:uracil-DNA glycosylase family protein [Kribbella shirazensis]|uniref:Uracil-DNA glycosylase n=1 Tax=Kribbella shirazensis TaxID=1105143 RepID=A0A7X6A4C4_9ACTN|nr:uracil-DNA glycosylase family protein [Kribbella shirazensis]NIK60860.1 uracil-DNA glycosylase [Kribbella shirazensis]
MGDFDPGPPAAVARHFATVPSYADFRQFFWHDWGPIFYRGRLNGTARLLAIASDPGPTERIAGRTLVGDAGQRVQGFLTKLGLTRSYALVNAYAYALRPSLAQQAAPLLSRPDQLAWRNTLFDLITGPQLQAIVAFGAQARSAVRLWTDKPDVPVFEVPHPSSRTPKVLLDKWREAITDLRAIVTPDPDGDSAVPNYGVKFTESDYAPVPHRDLPFGVPPWLGDDAWGRKDKPRHNNCVERPATDLLNTLVWRAPKLG